ncbi:MAG TPA: uroporphyrinogen-III synthase, partial [Mesorhizobium sp.]
MRRRVLVTRPEPGASRTANRLAALGLEPVGLPLTQMLALPVALAGLPGGADRVAATSANALRLAPKALTAALAHLPCHAVGAKTADAARAAGFLCVHEGPGDAGALADEIAALPQLREEAALPQLGEMAASPQLGEMAASPPGRKIVYLCGRVRLAAFEERLRTAGISVDPVETYDTLAIERESVEIVVRLSGAPVDAVLLYSAGAARAMLGVLGRLELAHLFANAMFLCLSDRVAASLGSVDGGKVRI